MGWQIHLRCTEWTIIYTVMPHASICHLAVDTCTFVCCSHSNLPQLWAGVMSMPASAKDSHCLRISGFHIDKPAVAKTALLAHQQQVMSKQWCPMHRPLQSTDPSVVCVQMDAAQQYNTNGRGYIPLLDWAKQHTQKLHAPPAGQQVVITSGSNHAIDVSFSLILFAAKPFWCSIRLQVVMCMCSRQ